jgi:beta-glucosidase
LVRSRHRNTALGIATALSPQIGLGTEPRWSRINGTFGEDPQLDADMARGYVDGFQYAHAHSIAAGDPVEPGITNRSYKGKTIISGNAADLKTIQDTKKAMQGKPVIVCLFLSKPAVVSEFEKEADGIFVSFGVQNQALLDVIAGVAEPSGLLPVPMPVSMKYVELQSEDIPHDMIWYTDANGNTYNFGFGLNWKGVISDTRTERYANIIKQPVIEAAGNKITITASTPGSKIYYTLDGSTPSFMKENE